ncbi:MAG: SprB repeat-containing protein [Saprospiraceae bacterium]
MKLRLLLLLGFVVWLQPQALAWQTQSGVSLIFGSQDISCKDAQDGSIRFVLLSGDAPVMYQWANQAQGLSGNGQLPSVFSADTILNLPPGDYAFTFTDALGVDTVLTAMIFEPDLLVGSVQVLSNYNGYQVACANGMDGHMLASIQGGTPPYAYTWSSGENNAEAFALAPGPGMLEVLDAQSCPLNFSFTLSAPPLLSYVLDVVGEKCLGENSGVISIEQLQGGVPPYAFALDGVPANGQMHWMNLVPGIYPVEVRDANGCTLTQAAVLPTGLEFVFDAGPDQELFTGDTLALAISTDRPVDTVLVFPPGESWYQNGTLYVFPQFSTDFLIVPVDLDGCQAEDELYIQMHRKRSVYAPNVLWPDASRNENRYFTLYGGGGISGIASLEVYNRLGKRVFSATNIPMGSPIQGWDGYVEGSLPEPGVFLWQAVVQYTDGRLEQLTGDVLLLR